jgi:hypothetical protein
MGGGVVIASRREQDSFLGILLTRRRIRPRCTQRFDSLARNGEAYFLVGMDALAGSATARRFSQVS